MKIISKRSFEKYFGFIVDAVRERCQIPNAPVLI